MQEIIQLDVKPVEVHDRFIKNYALHIKELIDKGFPVLVIGKRAEATHAIYSASAAVTDKFGIGCKCELIEVLTYYKYDVPNAMILLAGKGKLAAEKHPSLPEHIPTYFVRNDTSLEICIETARLNLLRELSKPDCDFAAIRAMGNAIPKQISVTSSLLSDKTFFMHALIEHPREAKTVVGLSNFITKVDQYAWRQRYEFNFV